MVFLDALIMVTCCILMEQKVVHGCFLLPHVIHHDPSRKTYSIVDFQS
jgi:hypothetical protein